MTEKNKYGQYFTIGLIAEFMVKLITHPTKSKVLEPSCGKGIFLDYLAQYGFTDISAYEIDKTLGSRHDFVKFESFLSVPTSEKYDVVIGNPPYIRWKNIEPELKAELEGNGLWNKYFNSLCDYFFIFILKSIEHLNEEGELLFICTNYWMNTTHSATLRKYMCQNGYFADIYHFKEASLFEKVTASFVIFRYVKSGDRQRHGTITLHRFNKERGLPTREELESGGCFDVEEIPHFKGDDRWILATQEKQDKLADFVRKCQRHDCLFPTETYRIGDFCDIGNGMVSGLDEAFQISNTDILNKEERKCIIPVIKAKDIRPYKHKGITNYIFLQENMTEEEFERKYPHFATHFKPYLEKLSKRYSYNRDIPYWEFVFPRNQRLLEQEKPRIFVPCKERISNKNYFRFCYTANNVYSTQDVTAILKKDNVKESTEFILAYLNNERVFDWLGQNGVIKGAIVEFSEAPIASIPFRPINWKSEREVEIHDRITEEVRCFMKDGSPLRVESINRHFNSLFNGVKENYISLQIKQRDYEQRFQEVCH